MTDLAISFFTSLVGGGAGIGVVVFALSKQLGSVWKERIGRLEDARITIETLQEQATIDTIAREHTADLEARIKLIEQDHERRSVEEEHFHQISQETYQKLFENKIDVYNELSTLLNNYYTNGINERDSMSIKHLSPYEHFDKFELLSKFILKNALYVSPELNELNYRWHLKCIKKINEVRASTILFNPMEKVNSYGVKQEENKIYSEFYNDTKEEIYVINKQLKEDIRKISKFIHYSRQLQLRL